MIFGVDDDKGFLITCDESIEFTILVKKFRFYYDLYLEYETCGYTITEYNLDSCPVTTTIPASKHADAMVEYCCPFEHSAWNHAEEDIDCVRKAVQSEKWHKHKSLAVRYHPCHYGRVLKLRREKCHKKGHKERMRSIKRERSSKCWRLHGLDTADGNFCESDCKTRRNYDNESCFSDFHGYHDYDNEYHDGGLFWVWELGDMEDWDGWEAIPPEALLPVPVPVQITSVMDNVGEEGDIFALFGWVEA